MQQATLTVDTSKLSMAHTSWRSAINIIEFRSSWLSQVLNGGIVLSCAHNDMFVERIYKDTTLFNKLKQKCDTFFYTY